METAHKQEFRIRDLPTRSVTLFPTRAQVVRDIKDVPLKPGANQITIVGISPTVDEHSIKVEGTGSAVISDIAVELLPNRDIFQDIYPDSEDDASDSDSDFEPAEEHKTSPEMKSIRDQLQTLRDKQKREKETLASAEARLKIIEAYGNVLDDDEKKKVAIDVGIENYRVEREKVFKDHMDATVREREIVKGINTLVKKERELQRREAKEAQKAAKAKLKAAQAKEKEREKKRRRAAEKQKEKDRIRKERESFWPRQTYNIRITLEAASFSPMSSRRNSIASSTEITKVVPDKGVSEDEASTSTPAFCDLSLNYVTTSAFWAPTYDMQLSTTSNTAMLCFDARLTNMTSEAWNNCKVILSTSQTTFGGVEETIPQLVPWRVKLAKGRGYDDLLGSREESVYKNEWRSQQAPALQPRAHLFGVGHSNQNNGMFEPEFARKSQPVYHEVNQMRQMAQMQQPQSMAAFAQAPPPPAPSGGFGQSNVAVGASLFGGGAPVGLETRSGGLFGASASRAPQSSSAFGSMAVRKRAMASPTAYTTRGAGGGGREYKDEAEEEEQEEGYGGGGGDGDDNTILPEAIPELEFQESAMEETGFTTTYDLPGLKTLVPSSTASKQRVARIQFTAVTFSHTVVAKYKPAAYLKAKLRNNSKLTLLKGQAGLTLDGSFMGRSTLPRCAAGATFSISLGVDPNIRVAYPKPDVKRSTTGLLSKQDSSVYRRTIALANTRAGAGSKAVQMLVLDQVPVSEDERLRVDILAPRGMAVGGSAVAAGVPGKEGKEERDWGRASATLKKGGEVSWEVVLNAGKTVKLALEYDVAVPSGEGVVQC